MSDTTNSKFLLKPLPFLLVHLAIAAAVGAWVMVRLSAEEESKELPELRDKPLTIKPLYNRPKVVSDADLQTVLYKLRPQLRGPRPRINHVDHALRFWGVEAKFADPKCLSGQEMRMILTDHRLFRRLWGSRTPSLMDKTLYGIRTRVQEGGNTSSHVDHTVASLVEVGTPLDYPVITENGETEFRQLVKHAIGDFSLNQLEYEWTAMVFALYMPTDQTWLTKEGQRVSFDKLAERIMRQRLTQGVCFGNHRLYSLTMLVRIDEQQKIFSPEMRTRVLDHLKNVTKTLIKTQNKKEGFWDRNWDGRPWDDSWNDQAPRSRRVLATGHALEWWAIAPKELLPPPEVIERAGQWIVKTVKDMTASEIKSGYTFLTHAGRAMALWRGKFPHEVYKPVRKKAKQSKQKK